MFANYIVGSDFFRPPELVLKPAHVWLNTNLTMSSYAYDFLNLIFNVSQF